MSNALLHFHFPNRRPPFADRNGALVSQETYICDSRKFVSKHVYPVTASDPPMYEVSAVCCEISAGVSADRAAAPSGVVTFLFTDVEGSTRRWEADADGMRLALAAHDEVLRGAIEAHGGFMFKHTGDGVCAAFTSPRSAVDAAVAAQRNLELPVRMGGELCRGCF